MDRQQIFQTGAVLRACVLLSMAGCAADTSAPSVDPSAKVAVTSQALSASDCPTGYNLIQGTSGNDTLNGTAGNDCILGLAGNDTIHGGGGNDYIAGGNGDDHIYGEGGNDQLFGESGIDTIEGGDGDDTIDGGASGDTLNGGAGNDTIDGGGGADVIDGGDGRDTIRGGDMEDTIHGGAGDDVIHGEGGNDQLYGDDGDDVIDGDANADSIWGGNGDDVIYGDVANDILHGEAGDDALIGGTGTNTSDGGPGIDACSGVNCEKAELVLSGCTQNAQCSAGKHCIADFGLCIGCVSDQDNDGICDSHDGCPLDVNKSSPGACGCGVADTDGDGDGVANCIDGCPSDASKIAPGVCGCGVSDADSDGDGTANCNDGCPSDGSKTAPGACGCGVSDADSDGDGTANCNDGCPADASKVAPGACGCGVSDADVDGDGVANCNDGCPTDAGKVSAGVCGCGVADTDSDGDGVANCIDGCPADASKISAGVCGCGVADTDSDGDGTANCNDGCPADANKNAAGICGCGVSDADSDRDGTANCNDGCPADAGKTSAGVCGCGIADTDSDGDGTANCNDGCPADPSKTAPGICGCGTSDGDSDGDGVVNCLDVCPGIADSSFDCLPIGQMRTRPLAQEVFDAGFTPQTSIGVLDINPYHPFSADGSTIVGVQNDYSGTDDRAFRWTVSNGLEWLANLPPLGYPNPSPYPSNGAFSTSADGLEVGGSCWDIPMSSPQIEGCRWAGASGSNPTPVLLTTTARTKYTYATSWDGQTMVGAGEERGIAVKTSAFRWTPSGVQTLGWLSLDSNAKAAATDVSADGSVVVGWSTSAQPGATFEPFRWTAAGGMVGLGFLTTGMNGQSGRATAISADGQMIVGWTNYSHDCSGHCALRYEPRAFRWTASGGMQPLPLPPLQSLPFGAATATYAHSVSPDGSVVLGTSSFGSGYFVWTPQRGTENVRDALIRLGVNVNGWTLSAIAVLKIGTTTYLTGYGQYQGGSPVVWRAAFQ